LKQDALTVGVALVHEYGPPIFAQNRLARFLKTWKHLSLDICGASAGKLIAQFLSFLSREVFSGRIVVFAEAHFCAVERDVNVL